MKVFASVSALLLACAALASTVAAAPPPPAELEVQEGDGWLRTGAFGLRWRNPDGASIAAVHFQVRDPLGTVRIGPLRIDHSVQRVERIDLPPLPGVYTAEVWLEDGQGASGPPASTRVRFDATRPGTAAPLPEAGWIGRAELPYQLRIAHPAGPLPPAGIRGYAISIGAPDEEGRPCADPAFCTDAETDLRGGLEDDTLTVSELPDGISRVRVVAVSGSGMHSVASGETLLSVDRIDPTTRLQGSRQGWSDGTVVLRAIAIDDDSGMGPGATTAIRVDDRPPAVSAGDTVGLSIVDEGIHTVAYYARDAAGNTDDGRSTNGHRNPRPKSTTVRIDRTPPSVFLVGSVGPQEPETIEARVADALAGADPGRGAIAVRALGSTAAFDPLPTTVSDGVLRASWATDEFPPGEYEFRATGFDAAGNAASSTRRANGSPLVLPNPLKPGARLVADLRGNVGSSFAAGRAIEISGRLSFDSGNSAGGEQIEVVEEFDPGAHPGRRATVATTAGDGGFVVRLEPGPSRRLSVRYRGDALTGGAVSSPIRIEVRPRVALRTSAHTAIVGGKPIRFSGKVVPGDGPVPPELAIELQFRLPGMPWRSFRTLRVDRRGRFAYRYSFSDDDSRGARFKFRAVVPSQSDWPFAHGVSMPVSVDGA